MKFSNILSRIWIPRRLTSRLILSHLLVGLVTIGLVGGLASYLILDTARQEAEYNLQEHAGAISHQVGDLEDIGPGGISDNFRQLLDRFRTDNPGMDYLFFDPSGTIKAMSGQLTQDEAVIAKFPDAQKALIWNQASTGRQMIRGIDSILAVQPMLQNNQLKGILLVYKPLNTEIGPAIRSLATLWLMAILVLLFVILQGAWLANTLARPIRALTRVTEKLSEGDLATRATAQGPLEMRQLTETFNRMAGRLQNNVEGMQAFVANASHELRTPLTAIRLHVEALEDGAINDLSVAPRFLSQIEGEVDRMNNTVNDLLDLSRIEAHRNLRMEDPVELDLLVLEAKEFWQVRAETAGLELRASLPAFVPMVRGDEDQLRRMINNLVENAIKYTPSGGWVELFLAEDSLKKALRLEVRDNGFGISTEHLPHVFERFYRVDDRTRFPKSTGSGLGLAIVKSIVEVHGGEVGVNSMPGTGTTFWVELPVEV